MSLESKIEILTKAITELTLKLETIGKLATTTSFVIPADQIVVPESPATPVVMDMTAPVEYAKTVAELVVPLAPAPAASVMPPPPTFTAPEAPSTPTVPFTDGKGLLTYVMEAYKTLGPVKGAQIQSVLTKLGYQNIHDVKPEDYAALHAGVEALKV